MIKPFILFLALTQLSCLNLTSLEETHRTPFICPQGTYFTE